MGAMLAAICLTVAAGPPGAPGHGPAVKLIKFAPGAQSPASRCLTAEEQKIEVIRFHDEPAPVRRDG